MSMGIYDLILAALAIVCVALVLLSPVACTMLRDKAIAAAIIKAGVDPIAARCALDGGSQMCMEYVRARKP